MTNASVPVIEEASSLFLAGKEAKDLMTPKVVAIESSATVAEAATLLMEMDLHAVPVTDQNGRPFGVLSRTDIFGYDHRLDRQLARQIAANVGVTPLAEHGGKDQGARSGSVRVLDVMSPVIYSVAPNTAAKAVIDAMLTLGVHRLFVIDSTGSLLGVISATDILRHLHTPTKGRFDNAGNSKSGQ